MASGLLSISMSFIKLWSNTVFKIAWVNYNNSDFSESVKMDAG